MARIGQIGWEQNSTTQEAMGVSGAPTIDSVIFRSGAFALKITSLSSATPKYNRFQFSAANGNGPYYFRAYFRIDTLPSAANSIIYLATGTATTKVVGITIDNTGVLQLSDEDGNIGSPSTPLSTGTWYRIEIKIDKTLASGSHIVEAKLDGIVFAKATNRALSVGVQNFVMGGNLASEAQTTGLWWFDDAAINDSTGSFQNTYPGSGKIIHLKPNTAGDLNSFTRGGADSGNNWDQVNEVTPNDATDYNFSIVGAAEDLFACEDSGIGKNDKINVVACGARFANLIAADATTSFRVEIKRTTGDFVQQNLADIIPNSTSWATNASANPRIYPLVTYNDPSGVAWKQSELDLMQIGYDLDAVGANSIAISTIWASVDYTPQEKNDKFFNFFPLAKVLLLFFLLRMFIK